MYIHQIWIHDTIDDPPECYKKEWTQSFKDAHPNYIYKLWKREDIFTLIKENEESFPGLYNIFVKVNTNIILADITKYVLMYIYGGIVADLDVKCLKSLHSFVDNGITYFNGSNQMIISSKDKILFKEFIIKIIADISKYMNIQKIPVLKTVGPLALNFFIKDRDDWKLSEEMCAKNKKIVRKLNISSVFSIHIGQKFW